MQPSNDMLEELRSLAADHTCSEARMDIRRMLSGVAHAMGTADGKIELARKILEDLARGE